MINIEKMQINKVISLSLLSSVVLFGANIPNINSGNIEKQLIAPKVPIEKKESVEIQGLDNKDSIKADVGDSKIFIKDFSFSGNSVISSEELKSNLKDYVNKELTFNQIQEVLAVVTKVYRDKGYFVARAYLGKQDLLKNDNVLNITILEGKLDVLKLNNSSLVKDSSLEAVLNGVKSNDILNVYDIEKIMLLINDRAGVMVNSVNISPGEKIGTSNFNIETVPENRVDGYVVADNYGSRYTGYNRFQGLVNINSPFNIGDKLTISGIVSNGADLKNGRLAYELPLMSNGLKANFAYSRTNYNLVKEYKALDADGKSDVYEVGLSYPIMLKNDSALYTRAKYYHKDMKDYIDNKNIDLGDKKIDSVVATLDFYKNYSFFNLPARISTNLNFTSGYLKDKLNSNNSGRYNKIDTTILNDIAFSNIFSLSSTLTAQKVLGNKNLDGSEDFSLGGAYGVRVYPYSEQSGENGYILNLELLSKLPNIFSYSHKVGVFYDMGDVYQKHQDANFERRVLKDVGLGYYANYKDLFLRTQIAWTLNSKEITSENTNHKNGKFLIQAGLVF